MLGIFIFSLALLSFANPASSLELTSIKEVLSGNVADERNLTTFYPIGFSNDGLFGFFSRYRERDCVCKSGICKTENYDGSCACTPNGISGHFVVNLKSDKLQATAVCGKTYSESEVSKNFAKLGIVTRELSLVKPPFKFGNDEFQVEFKDKKLPAEIEGESKTERKVYLVSKLGGRKLITTKILTTLPRYSFDLLGCYIDSQHARAAFVFVQSAQLFEDENSIGPLIIGADLKNGFTK